MKVGAVDMDVHGSVGGPYNVRGFPTIKIFGSNKKSPQDYNGMFLCGISFKFRGILFKLLKSLFTFYLLLKW